MRILTVNHQDRIMDGADAIANLSFPSLKSKIGFENRFPRREIAASETDAAFMKGKIEALEDDIFRLKSSLRRAHRAMRDAEKAISAGDVERAKSILGRRKP